MTEPQPTTTPRPSPVLRWAMAIFTVTLISLALILPRPFPALIFGGSLLIAFGISLWRYGWSLLRLIWQRGLSVVHPRVFMLIALVLMCLSAYYFRPNLDAVFPLTPDVGRGFLLWLGGVGFLLITVWLREDDSQVAITMRSRTPTLVSLPLRRWGLRPFIVLVGVGLLFIAMEMSAEVLKIRALQNVHYREQLVFLFAGMVITVFGLAYSPRAERDLERIAKIRHQPIIRVEWLILLGITGLALFIRWWELDTRLQTLVDELNFISHVAHYYEIPHNPILRPMTNIVPFTRIFSFWESITIAFFERDLAGIRAMSGIIGTLNVVALWWLLRQIFDRRVALAGALLLATFPPHIHFSSLALNNIVDPLFGTLALAFILRGLRTNRRMDYVLGGASLGLIPYFYEGGRLIFPILLVLWLLWVAWFVWKRQITPQRRRNIIIMGITATIFIIPVYYNVISWTGNPTGRMAFSGLDGTFWEDLVTGDTEGAITDYVNNLARSFLFYINRFETFIHYGGYVGLILPVFVPMFLLGLGFALYGMFRRNAGTTVLLFWFGLSVFGNSVLIDPAVSTRHVVAFPAVAALMALGLVWTLDILFHRKAPFFVWYPTQPTTNDRPQHERLLIKEDLEKKGKTRHYAWLISLVILVDILVLTGVRQVDYYFNDHLPLAEQQIRELAPYRDVTDALLRMRDVPEGTHITLVSDYIYSGRDARDFLRYVADGLDIDTIMNYEIPDDYFALLDFTRPQIFLLPPDDTDTQALIRAHFGYLPEGQTTTNPHVLRDEVLIRYDIPPTVYTTPPEPVQAYHQAHHDVLTQMGAWSAFALSAMVLLGVMRWRLPALFAPIGQAMEALDRRLVGDDTVPPIIPRPNILITGIVLLLAVTVLNASQQTTLILVSWVQITLFICGVMLIVGGFVPHRASQPNAPRGLFITRLLAWIDQRFATRWLPRPNMLLGGIGLLIAITIPNMLNRPEICFPVWVQITMFLLAIYFIMRGLTGEITVHAPPAHPEPAWTWAQIRAQLRVRLAQREAWLVVGVVLLALTLRVVDLERGVYWFVDEMHSAQAVVDLWETPYAPIFTPHSELTAFTWVYPLMQSLGVAIYGPTLTGLRVISALMGVGTVLALWWLARSLFDKRIALLVAVILATFPPHIHFSRLGINNIADPLFGTLALALLLRGLDPKREPRPFDFALAGAMLGMTQYFYEGGRLLFPTLALILVIVVGIRQGRALRWRGVIISLVVFTLVALPVYLTWRASGLPGTPRLDMTVDAENYLALFQRGEIGAGISTMIESLWDAVRALTITPDQIWFYGGDFALMLPVLLPLFVIGVGRALRHWREPRMVLILLWIVGAIIGNSLLETRLESPRYVVVFPALMLAVALGVDTLVRWFPPRRFALASAVMALALVQTGYYFAVHLPQFTEDNQQAALFDDMLFRLVTLPQGTQVYIITDDIIRQDDIRTMLAYHRLEGRLLWRVLGADEITDTFMMTLPEAGRFAFFLRTDSESVETTLRTRFDLSRVFYSPYDTLPQDAQYRLYYVAG